jgi:hypothetical protein
MSKGKEQGSSEVFFCLGPAFLMASFMPVLLRSLETVSQEMGHFRPEITEVYLK